MPDRKRRPRLQGPGLEGRFMLRGDHLAGHQSFLIALCTVITGTRPTQPSSTALSASRRSVQRFRHGGACEQAKATRRASNAPSKITSRGGFARRLRSRAASRSCSTKRY